MAQVVGQLPSLASMRPLSSDPSIASPHQKIRKKNSSETTSLKKKKKNQQIFQEYVQIFFW
jgi:hypothetical protein